MPDQDLRPVSVSARERAIELGARVYELEAQVHRLQLRAVETQSKLDLLAILISDEAVADLEGCVARGTQDYRRDLADLVREVRRTRVRYAEPGAPAAGTGEDTSR